MIISIGDDSVCQEQRNKRKRQRLGMTIGQILFRVECKRHFYGCNRHFFECKWRSDGCKRCFFECKMLSDGCKRRSDGCKRRSDGCKWRSDECKYKFNEIKKKHYSNGFKKSLKCYANICCGTPDGVRSVRCGVIFY
ncbi:MAG: hypothetical protein LBC98_01105 [Prevotellaceae bacterium]|nr:hypothetical protein [Prevotellaceae bacterium]